MNGALIIDKPAGMTSHDVVAHVRTILGERRVGHTGTLDPFATGVLVILIGRATRLAQFLSGAEKEYEAVIRLGFATDTGDMTGTVLEESATETQRHRDFQPGEIKSALSSLRGEIEQTPPMYSAKKFVGKKLYELARRGEEVERKPVHINVRTFEMINSSAGLLAKNDDGSCDLGVRVVCSAGTYVRVLAEDFGKRLGVAAHLASLRRTGAGQFKIQNAISLERLSELVESNSISRYLISPDAALSFLPSVDLRDEDVKRTQNGIDLKIEQAVGANWLDAQPVRMRDASGNLIAVGTFGSVDKVLHPGVVVSNNAS